MRVAVLGTTGLLGSHIAQHLSDLGHDVVAPRRLEVDVLQPDTLGVLFAGNVRGDDTAIDALVNAVAYTDTDKAEREPGLAQLLNCDAAARLAHRCRIHGVRFLHLSTELVLGSSSDPQYEDAPVRPVGVYASTKAEAEEQVLRINDRAVVLRTCSVYGHGGRNWSSAIAGKLLDEQTVRADMSRLVEPNSAIEVSRAVARVLASNLTGIVHASGMGATTWAKWCRSLARELEVPEERVIEYRHPYRVPRPEVMLASRYEEASMRSTRVQLAEYAGLCREVGP